MYQVSDWGRVKALKRNAVGKGRNQYDDEHILKLHKCIFYHKKRVQTALHKNGVKKYPIVARLVYETFVGDIPENMQVNHIDENPSNNCVENLEWCDSEYNNNYGGHYERAYNHKGENNPMYGMTGDKCPTSKKVYCIELNEVYNSMREAERKTGINNSCISDACKGKQKTAGKHPITGERLHWKYVED